MRRGTCTCEAALFVLYLSVNGLAAVREIPCVELKRRCHE